MSACYHKLLPPDLQKNLRAEEIAQKARDFAHGEYAQALDTVTEQGVSEGSHPMRILRHRNAV
jgi:hypothetical protein